MHRNGYVYMACQETNRFLDEYENDVPAHTYTDEINKAQARLRIYVADLEKNLPKQDILDQSYVCATILRGYANLIAYDLDSLAQWVLKGKKMAAALKYNKNGAQRIAELQSILATVCETWEFIDKAGIGEKMSKKDKDTDTNEGRTAEVQQTNNIAKLQKVKSPDVEDEDDGEEWYLMRINANKTKKVIDFLKSQKFELMSPIQALGCAPTSRDGRIYGGTLLVKADKDRLQFIKNTEDLKTHIIWVMNDGEPMTITHEDANNLCIMRDAGSIGQQLVDPDEARIIRRGRRGIVTYGKLEGFKGSIATVDDKIRLVASIKGLFSISTPPLPREWVGEIETEKA